MTLKANFTTIILTSCLLVLITTSCGSHKQKPVDAFDLVKKERMMTADSSFVSKEVIQESMKTEPVKKIETPDEWTKFKNGMEKKIRKNENTIKEIEGLPELNASLRRKVTNLKKANSDMRIRMDEYKEEVKTKWEMFQASMNHTINEIDIELNSLKADNKK